MSVDSLFLRFEARHQQLEAPGRDQALRRSHRKRLHGVLFDTKKTGQVRGVLELEGLVARVADVDAGPVALPRLRL